MWCRCLRHYFLDKQDRPLGTYCFVCPPFVIWGEMKCVGMTSHMGPKSLYMIWKLIAFFWCLVETIYVLSFDLVINRYDTLRDFCLTSLSIHEGLIYICVSIMVDQIECKAFIRRSQIGIDGHYSTKIWCSPGTFRIYKTRCIWMIVTKTVA